MATHNPSLPGPMPVSGRLKTIGAALLFVGVVTFVVMLLRDRERAWHAYLAGYWYFFALGIGGLFFTAVQHITRAGWSVNVRRFFEAQTAYLPFALVGGVILFAAGPNLYEWMDKSVVAGDALLQHKSGYLNFGFFCVRTVLFFCLWLFFKAKLVGRSVEQDKSGDDNITRSSVGYGIATILVFAISFSLYSVDLLMSLDPHWFSTIFGVYCFAGMFQTSLAAITLLIVYTLKKGYLKGVVNENHLHDMGKYLFGFTVFWAYIAFSQFMLMWYANMPEETSFFIPRMTGSWTYVSLALIILKFIVPFLALLPRWAKRSPNHMAAVAILILITHYIDVYWLVYPNLNQEEVIFSLPEILIWGGFAGAFLLAVTRFLGKNNLVPVKDPRISESLHHHVTY
jgi:hypothetical protein